MKTNFILICLLILLCISATSVNLNSQDLPVSPHGTKDGETFTIKGMNQIHDPEFKKMLSQYLFLNREELGSGLVSCILILEREKNGKGTGSKLHINI